MADLSNKTLATIMAVALGIFLVGVVLNTTIPGGLLRITGKATGTAQLTITSVTELTNQVSSINWGSGYVNASYNNCTMDSEGTLGAGCVTFTAQTSGFLMENTGNTNLSVNYTSDSAAAAFIGGTNPEFQLKVSPNSVEGQSGESSATDTVTSCVNNWSPGTYTDITTAGTYMCGNSTAAGRLFRFEGDRDAAVVDIRVVIPEDAPIEAKSATLTFNGAS